ncbi:MAG TPA: thiamine-phosphate kinase [Alphaproteobacteria bacterium]|nr:thiamine-phosphate kinase [Alphaproteobacteria bacterium]
MAGEDQGRGRPGEFELIARLFAPLAARFAGAVDLADDVAYLALHDGLVAADEELVVKTDALVAGIHFLVEDPPDLVARKLLRVNLSDLAAKGARPLVYTLALMVPPALDYAWLTRFAEGLRLDQEAYGIVLAGGDTVSTPGPLALSVTALGAVPAGRRMLRGNARPGDGVFVSGTIGDGALGLKAIQGRLLGLGGEHRAALAARYRLPQPRLSLGRRLLGLAHASMDVSDGLIGDLEHICATSSVAAVVQATLVPLSDAGRAALAADPGLIEDVLGGGDDYELLFTAPAADEAALVAIGRELEVPVSRIGAIAAGSGVRVEDAAGREIAIARRGFRHF